MPVVLVESHGQLFGFCSQSCARRWRDGLPALENKECTTPFGCWLCGGDVQDVRPVNHFPEEKRE